MPSLEVIIKLSYEFNVSIEYLLGIEKNKTLDISGLTEEQVSAVSEIINLFRKQNTEK